jgi:hypothetical protein
MTNSDPAEENKKINLFDYTEDDLLLDHALDHYEILNLPHHCTQNDVKKVRPLVCVFVLLPAFRSTWNAWQPVA